MLLTRRRFFVNRRAAAGLALLAALCLPSTAFSMPPGEPGQLGQKRLEACWLDLEKGEVEASRALLNLRDHGNEAVPFLKTRLKPLEISAVDVKRLILKLNSADEHVWKPAFDELAYFDPRLTIALPDLMERVTEMPARQRLVEVLSDDEPGTLDGWQIKLTREPGGFNFHGGVQGALWAEPKISELDRPIHGHLKKKWTRADRALVLLEHVRSPEAVSILKEMATGHPDAVPTSIARQAIKNVTAVRAKTLDALWSDLEGSEAEAARALLAMFGRGQEGVVFLKHKLKPLAITPDRLNSLLLELNSADEHVWAPAFEELAYFDPRLAIEIPDLMKLVPQAPARQRLVAAMRDRDADWLAGSEIEVLSTQDGYHFRTSNRTFWAPAVKELNTARFATVKRKWTRANRAIVLLEHVRTPLAVAILKVMATGHPDALPTKVARDALVRINSARN